MNNYTSLLLKGFLGKKIIIAGCNGYIGSELCNQLDLNGLDYIGIDKSGSFENNYLKMDLLNNQKVKDLIEVEKPDIFVHTATHSALAYRDNFIDSFREDNQILFNIITGLKKLNKTKLIYFSSSYIYSGLNLNNSMDEKAVLNPSHNFGVAKSFFEKLIFKERPKSIILRLSSVFGIGNYLHPNAIETLAKEAIIKKRLTLWGKGERKMQYVFLEDVIKSILMSVYFKDGIYNVCGQNYETMMDTAKKIAKFYNSKLSFLVNKVEGETLPFMKSEKIIKEVKKDFFSNYDESLNKYLAQIKNKII